MYSSWLRKTLGRYIYRKVKKSRLGRRSWVPSASIDCVESFGSETAFQIWFKLKQDGSGLCIPASPSQVTSALEQGSFLHLRAMHGEGSRYQPSVDSRFSSWGMGSSASREDLGRAPQYPLCLVFITRLTVIKILSSRANTDGLVSSVRNTMLGRVQGLSGLSRKSMGID